MSARQHWEDTFDLQIRACNLPEPVSEHRFAKPRRWAFDKAWIDQKIAVEVEGAIFANGRHTRGSGYLGDMEKYNAAAMLDWKVLRYTPQQIWDGVWIDDIKALLENEREG